MSEVLVLSPVGRIHQSLNLGIPNMSFLQHRPDSTRQVLGVHVNAKNWYREETDM
jgi:hypothetical protein